MTQVQPPNLTPNLTLNSTLNSTPNSVPTPTLISTRWPQASPGEITQSGASRPSYDPLRPDLAERLARQLQTEPDPKRNPAHRAVRDAAIHEIELHNKWQDYLRRFPNGVSIRDFRTSPVPYEELCQLRDRGLAYETEHKIFRFIENPVWPTLKPSSQTLDLAPGASFRTYPMKDLPYREKDWV